MYCSQCSCQLPHDAQFCLRCGARVAQQPIAPSIYYCVQCGVPYESSFRFCNRCGQGLILHPNEAIGTSPAAGKEIVPPGTRDRLEEEAAPLPAPPLSSEAVALLEEPSALPDQPESTPEMAPAEISPSIKPVRPSLPRPPVIRFVLLELGTMLASSVIVFSVADDLAREAMSLWVPLVIAICALPILLHYVGKTYRESKAIGTVDEAIAQAGKRLLRHGIVFAVIFMVTACAVGYAIGSSGTETEHLVTDLSRYQEIARRIGEQRNGAARTISSHIEMYDQIGSDVRAYSALCATLHSQLTIYDAKYPSQHQSTDNTLHTIDNESRRADLLLKQIEVARRLRTLDDDQQWTVWQSEMEPLLEQEKALN